MALRALHRLIRIGIGMTLAALVLGTGPAAAQTKIKFSLDGRVEGPSAFFLVPLDKGYFKAEGLDVTIDPASSALEPVKRVATGGYDIAFADINVLIKFRDQNPTLPIKAVFMVYNKPPYSIVSRKSRGIATPKDLEGKRLGAPAMGATAAQWPLFAKLTGIDVAKVKVENVGIPVRAPMLAAGQVDAVTGYSFNSYINLKDRGVPVNDIVLMLMPDYGMILYGAAIIVNPKFQAEHPEAVSGFLRAFLKGLKETVRNPGNAVESVVRRNELAKREVELERLRMAIKDNVRTPEVRTNGYGAVDMSRLAASIDQLALTYPFKAKPKATDIFDESFLPPANTRAAR
jgi:NitT/TauT family transport system substrate-binding protein